MSHIEDPLQRSDGRERILVVRNGHIGDTLLAIPFLRNLRRAFPNATIDVLVEPGSGTVLAACPYKDELIPWNRPRRVRGVVPDSLSNIVANANWLRSRGYARAYVLKRSFSSALLVWLAGIPHRVGRCAQGRGPLLNRAVRVPQGRHEVQHFLDLLRGDGIAVDDGRNENWVSEHARTRIVDVLGPVSSGRRRVFLAPKATNRLREWPAERMARVMDWLVAEHDCEVFCCGAPRDMEEHEAIRSAMQPGFRGRLHDLTDALKLQEVGGLMSAMDLYVGVDTGLAHLAASYHVPVVVLFGPSDPNQWHPWDTPCEVVRGVIVRQRWPQRLARRLEGPGSQQRRWPLGKVSMLDITIEQVTSAVTRLLRERTREMPSQPQCLRRNRSTTPIGS